jgi:hypothetical protein
MLAETTGNWIVAIIAGVLVVAGWVAVFWLLYRLVTWPSRRRRRLDSDYEQMIRQQPQTRPPTGDGTPYYQLPPDWQQRLGQPVPAAPSQVMLPPPTDSAVSPTAPEEGPVETAAPPSEDNGTKTCPDCAETVLAAAKVCRYCHYRFDQPQDSAITQRVR